MPRQIALSYLTLLDCDPFERIRIAAEAGFDLLGLRLLPATPMESVSPLMTQPRLRRDVIAALGDVGLRVCDVEVIRLTPELSVSELEGFMACAAELGARHICVAGNDPDSFRIIDNFADLCRAAAPYNLSCDLEFTTWSDVKDLRTARSVVEKAAQPNGSILIDALHADRSHATLEEIAALPKTLMRYVQLCDGPADYHPSQEELVRIARSCRLLPGQGGIDCVGLVTVVPPSIPISLEIPNERQQSALGMAAYAQAAMRATRLVLEAANRRVA